MEGCKHLGPLFEQGIHGKPDLYNCAIYKHCTLQNYHIRRSNGAPFAYCSVECAGRSSSGSLKAVMVTPTLGLGGAEQWIRMLVSRSTEINWRVVLLNAESAHESVVNAILRRAPIVSVGKSPRFSFQSFDSADKAINAAVSDADIVVTWGGHWPINSHGRPIVMVAHGSCQYTQDCITDAEKSGATHLVCVSQKSADSLKTGLKKEIIWNGVDTSRLGITKQPTEVRQQVWNAKTEWWSHENVYVGYLGRLAPEKNAIAAAQAVSLLPWQYKCVLIGGGPEARPVIEQAQALAGPRLTLVDPVDDVGNHLNALDVFVQASHKEGNSLSLIDAMMAGIPIVTTRVGAVEEFEAAAGQSLFYSLPDYPTAHEIADAVREAAKAGRNADRVIAAKEFAQRELTAKTMVRKWEEYLLEAVEKSGERRRGGDREWGSGGERTEEFNPQPKAQASSRKFAFFTGTNRPNEKTMIETMIKSARSVGVTADFHLFAPMEVEGTIHHPIDASRSWNMHMAKIEFLLDLKDVDAEYFVWLDTDNYFVRDPGDFSDLIRDEPCWVSMESDMTSPNAKFQEWYGIFLKPVPSKPMPDDVIWPTVREIWSQFSAKGVYNTNAGMFIVRRDAIQQFHDKCFEVFNWLHANKFHTIPDEPPLAIAGAAMVSDPKLNMFDKHSHVWACDWHDTWTQSLPDGKPWKSKDWLTQTDGPMINPAIIHLMRGKQLMNGGKPFVRQVSPNTPITREPVGTKLAEILKECGIERPANCDCNKWTGLMNQGIEWCQKNRTQIVNHLNDAASKAGWLAMAKVAARGYFSIDSLIDEAVKRTIEA